jgi:serine/threonine protein kinase
LIAERYRLDEQIGVGGMGVVWRATDTELGRVVALKQSQQGDNGQIRREARIGAGLHHPRVVTVFDVVHDGDGRWLVMEYLPSRSLSTILATDGPLSPDAAARIGAQIADALAAMHEQGMAHRDVKPGNILVTDTGIAKLADFGVARWADVTVTDSGNVGGTPGYLAPEVADGHEARAPADVFSLGATLFAAVEGGSPWGDGERGPFAQLRRAATGEVAPMERAGPLAPVLTELMRKAPADRPTALAAKSLLEDITGDTIPVLPMSSTPPPQPRSRKRRLALISAAAVVVVALVAGLVVFLNRESPQANNNTVGDERTADPCSLIDRAALARFGTVTLDLDYGHFNECNVVVNLDNDKGDATVLVGIEGPPEYPSKPHTPGQLGPVDGTYPPTDNDCRLSFRLPDSNQVVVTANKEGGGSELLCAMANAITSGAISVLSQGPIPRRTASFTPDSLAKQDACALLTDADLVEATGARGLRPEPDFGRWRCYWESDQVEVDLSFIREWKGDAAESGERVEAGAGEAFLEMETSDDTDNDMCVATIVQRTYTRAEALQKDWEEEAVLTVEMGKDATEDQLCAAATTLVTAVAGRLPG